MRNRQWSLIVKIYRVNFMKKYYCHYDQLEIMEWNIPPGSYILEQSCGRMVSNSGLRGSEFSVMRHQC